jgi:hypothetical protein
MDRLPHAGFPFFTFGGTPARLDMCQKRDGEIDVLTSFQTAESSTIYLRTGSMSVMGMLRQFGEIAMNLSHVLSRLFQFYRIPYIADDF